MNPQNPNNLTQEQIKAGYSTVVGPYDPVTGKLKTTQPINAPATQPLNNVISNIDLQSQPKLTLPTTPTLEPTKPAPIDYDAMFPLTDFQKQSLEAPSDLFKMLTENYDVLKNEQADLQAERQRQGIQDLNRQNQATKARILALDAEMQQDDIQLAQKLRAEERRDTLLPFAQMGQAKLAGDAAIYRALKTAEKNTLISQQLAQQGDIALAEQFAKDAIDAKYAPFKAQIEQAKTLFEIIKPTLTAAENKLLKVQELKATRAENEIKKAEEEEKNVLSLATTAAGNGAPSSLVSRISNAKTYREALTLAAQYTKDPLDRELKLAQINKLREEAAEKKVASSGNPEINRKVALAAKNLKSMMDKGIGTAAVGKSAIFMTSRIPGTEAANFRIQTDTLKSLLTLDNLKFLKGPTSDKDIAFLMSAGNKLNRQMTEEEFSKTLNDIYDTYSKYVPELQYADEVDNAVQTSQTSNNSNLYANNLLNE